VDAQRLPPHLSYFSLPRPPKLRPAELPEATGASWRYRSAYSPHGMAAPPPPPHERTAPRQTPRQMSARCPSTATTSPAPMSSRAGQPSHGASSSQRAPTSQSTRSRRRIPQLSPQGGAYRCSSVRRETEQYLDRSPVQRHYLKQQAEEEAREGRAMRMWWRGLSGGPRPPSHGPPRGGPSRAHRPLHASCNSRQGAQSGLAERETPCASQPGGQLEAFMSALVGAHSSGDGEASQTAVALRRPEVPRHWNRACSARGNTPGVSVLEPRPRTVIASRPCQQYESQSRASPRMRSASKLSARNAYGSRYHTTNGKTWRPPQAHTARRPDDFGLEAYQGYLTKDQSF